MNYKSLIAAATAVAAMLVTPALAQEWPAKPITMITGSNPGGNSDLFGRIFGDVFQQKTGQPWIMDNRPGANTTIAIEHARTSRPDGYTFLLTQIGGHSIVPNIFTNLTYDPIEDFEPVALLVRAPSVMFVRSDETRFTTVEELVAYAKAHPGELSYGVSSLGTSNNMSFTLFNLENELDMLMIPYASSGEPIVGLMRGDTDVAMESMQMVVGKDVKPLAVTSAARSPVLPDVPTMQEAGIEGFDVAGWFGIVAPKGTPRDIVDAMAEQIRLAGEDAGVLDKVGPLGAAVTFMGPDEFGEFMKKELALWADVVERADIPKQP